jgi:hypothetical protein
MTPAPRLLLLLVAVVLAGCASSPPADPGEVLVPYASAITALDGIEIKAPVTFQFGDDGRWHCRGESFEDNQRVCGVLNRRPSR